MATWRSRRPPLPPLPHQYVFFAIRRQCSSTPLISILRWCLSLFPPSPWNGATTPQANRAVTCHHDCNDFFCITMNVHGGGFPDPLLQDRDGPWVNNPMIPEQSQRQQKKTYLLFLERLCSSWFNNSSKCRTGLQIRMTINRLYSVHQLFIKYLRNVMASLITCLS